MNLLIEEQISPRLIINQNGKDILCFCEEGKVIRNYVTGKKISGDYKINVYIDKKAKNILNT